MKLLKVQRTPNPLAMKLTIDETLVDESASGVTYSRHEAGLPRDILRLFTITGINQIYRYADFMTVEKKTNADWKDILPQIKTILNG
ncbi:NifU N-terminal domain-containing protein [Brochothrix campestris]|uniref:Scaffold protein Nfu/NifU N-terminal domain-containing protein n=1 Tax=Brochothrix campestris FSL F6-1037 TaxID=1265861 RepID=W7CAD5_9LIST|nr:NifU N-terminal domain-containing protein [Brochothrix campestris]EUJ36304.1 hypothetical protein BCAMP_10845 [Brochothrix campestris FSL F6-1037]